MKKLFKILFATIGIILAVVLLSVVIVLIMISDKKDEFDANKINSTLTTQELLAKELNNGLNEMKDTYKLNLTFDENDLNSLIYAFVKQSINEDYDPINSNEDDKKYIMNMQITSGLSLAVKHAYATIDEEDVCLDLTAEAFGIIKTRVHLKFNIETTASDYILTIEEAKLGKINLLMKLALKSMKKNGLEDSANDFLEEKEIPFVLDITDLTLTSTKADFCNWVNKLLSKDEPQPMAETLINVLLSPENGFVKFGMINDGEFGASIDLSSLKVEEKETTLDPSIKGEFDANLLIKNKSQTLVLNSISGGDKSLNITEIEISKLIYTSTKGYESFNTSSEIMDGVNFNFSINGVIFDIGEDGKTVTIKLILNINGLLTTAVYKGNCSQDTVSQVSIKMDDTITLGKDLIIDSSFVGELLEDSFKESAYLSYDKSTNTFVISSSVFASVLENAGLNTTLAVVSVGFKTDTLSIGVALTDTSIQETLDKAIDLVNDALKGDFLDTSKFSDNPETQEILNKVTDELDDIKEKLNDPSFDKSTLETEDLIGAINELPTEDQETFFGQLQEAAGESDLSDLYSKLFGGAE